MKFCNKEIRALKEILDKGDVPVTAFGKSEMADMLVSAGAMTFVRTGKGRGRYRLTDSEGARRLAADADERLVNLEAFVNTNKNKPLKSSEQVRTFGSDKVVKRLIWDGIFLKASVPVSVIYENKETVLDERHPLLIEDISRLEIGAATPIIMVENYELFKDLSWMRHPEINVPQEAFVTCHWNLSKRAREEYGKLPNEKFYFGDMDLAGINIYQTQMAENTPPANFIIPLNIEDTLKRKGSTINHESNRDKYLHIQGISDEIEHLIQVIRTCNKALTQEYYIINNQ